MVNEQKPQLYCLPFEDLPPKLHTHAGLRQGYCAKCNRPVGYNIQSVGNDVADYTLICRHCMPTDIKLTDIANLTEQQLNELSRLMGRKITPVELDKMIKKLVSDSNTSSMHTLMDNALTKMHTINSSYEWASLLLKRHRLFCQ